jgi:hypothetical protein
MSNSTNTGRREQGGGRGEEEEEEEKKWECFVFFWVGFDGGSKESITLMVT